jgi:predicted DNA-binding protein (UPF0251 family)
MDLEALKRQVDEAVSMYDLITMKEASTRRGVSRSAILQLIQRDRLRTIVLAGKTLIYGEDLKNLTKQKPGPATGTIFKLKK